MGDLSLIEETSYYNKYTSLTDRPCTLERSKHIEKETIKFNAIASILRRSASKDLPLPSMGSEVDQGEGWLCTLD